MSYPSPVPNIPKPEEVDDAGRYFRSMAEFVGLSDEDAIAIRQSALIIEKHLPKIIADFYNNLLQYPPTRKFFARADGSIDEQYLKLRMFHQANFWRKTAGGEYDDEYAHFVNYVGRAHTSHGADPRLYIAERYVIGMVGFVQHAVIDALMRELHGYDDDLEQRAVRGWTKICMVILEMLSRAYGHERDIEHLDRSETVNLQELENLSVQSYELGLNMRRSYAVRRVEVAQAEEIPNGERKIVEIEGISIGVFHHKGEWYALRNKCLHRGGPVATGQMMGDNIVCPWHGYTYDLTSGSLLIDPTAKLEQYRVTVEDGMVYLDFPEEEALEAGSPAVMAPAVQAPAVQAPAVQVIPDPESASPSLAENEFDPQSLAPGQTCLVHLEGQGIAVYNVDGQFYATASTCTHAGGPLNEGVLEGKKITCPWHYSCFDVTNGAVLCPPASRPVETFKVVLEAGKGRVVADPDR